MAIRRRRQRWLVLWLSFAGVSCRTKSSRAAPGRPKAWRRYPPLFAGKSLLALLRRWSMYVKTSRARLRCQESKRCGGRGMSSVLAWPDREWDCAWPLGTSLGWMRKKSGVFSWRCSASRALGGLGIESREFLRRAIFSPRKSRRAQRVFWLSCMGGGVSGPAPPRNGIGYELCGWCSL